MSSSSPAGYIYPALWLQENYKKTITDLSKVVQADSYGTAFARLASGQTDLLVTFADARRDYEEAWTTDFNRKADIWAETDLIGVMPAIYNDTISVSKNSEIMDDELKKYYNKRSLISESLKKVKPLSLCIVMRVIKKQRIQTMIMSVKHKKLYNN